jgi:hypothetical protein
MKLRHRIMAIAVGSAMTLSLGLVGAASVASAAAPPAPYFNGFENSGDAITGMTSDTQAVFDVDRVTSGTDSIPAASGGWFAQAAANDYNTGTLNQFTRLGGYGSFFPTGGFTTSVDVFLDMNEATGANDLRFDWSTAISNTTGGHRRDFIFNVGTDPTTAGQFVMSASNNAPGWPANPGRNPITIDESGWYTFQTTFVDNGSGVLAAQMSVLDSSSNSLGTWVLSDSTDIIGTTVGGNRYAWLVHNDFEKLALDDITRTGAAPTPATGTWSQYPNGVTEYQAAVQQPINTANTSNWNSKSKGAIPVMFKLSSRTGPAVFESIGSDTSVDNDYAYASFTPDPGLRFDQVSSLKADYAFTLGNCHGGSLRWQVRTSPTEALHIYYGDEPNFTDCTTNSQSGVNMIGLSDLRYDTSQYPGGSFYDTYAHALEIVGRDTPVTRVSLVLDSGWQDAPNGDQRAEVSNITVNDNVYQWDGGGSGDFAATCDLPDATIEVLKGDPVVDGNINEQPVQASLADDGNAFRVVDCKYQYILSIPSLDGKGTYQVQIWIGGQPVPTPDSPGGKVRFDIK